MDGLARGPGGAAAANWHGSPCPCKGSRVGGGQRKAGAVRGCFSRRASHPVVQEHGPSVRRGNRVAGREQAPTTRACFQLASGMMSLRQRWNTTGYGHWRVREAAAAQPAFPSAPATPCEHCLTGRPGGRRCPSAQGRCTSSGTCSQSRPSWRGVCQQGPRRTRLAFQRGAMLRRWAAPSLPAPTAGSLR